LKENGRGKEKEEGMERGIKGIYDRRERIEEN
jgi:hypothetical protein